MQELDTCPHCGSALVHVSVCGDPQNVDTYCEDCGWPDELLPLAPPCAVCGVAGIGEIDGSWYCEDHWEIKNAL
jgi:hypothetical protein